MWFYENPWPGILIGVALAAVFLPQALRAGQKRDWVLGLLGIIVAVGSYYIEQAVVTPAEQIEANVHELVNGCIAGDTDKVVNMISNQNVLLKTIATAGLSMTDIHPDFHVTDLSVNMVANDSRGLSHFRANGTISVGSISHTGHATTRWEVTWQKEGEDWKILNIQRLNPITGEEMETLKRSET